MRRESGSGDMRALARFVLALGVALLAVAQPAAAQTEVADPPDPWIHAATGTAFPAAVAGFSRNRVIEYSQDGRDAGVNYALSHGDEWLIVSLYVYPAFADLDCEGTYEDARGTIAAYSGAQLLGEARDPPPSGRGEAAAYHARFLLPAGAIRPDIQEARSDVYLYCPAGGQWLVKYRATGSAGADFAPDVEALLHAIAWPGNLGG
jgi:hypothetical protein